MDTAPKNPAIKPGELLPSVLRTSADLGTGCKLPPATAGASSSGNGAAAGSEARKDAQEANKKHAGPRLAAGDAAASAMLPRLEPSSAAHYQALPARPVLSTSPPRQRPGANRTPERRRAAAAATAPAASGAAGTTPIEQQPLRSSGDGPPTAMATAAAAAACRGAASPTHPWKHSEVPAVGSVAMSPLPAALYWQAGPHSPSAATASAHQAPAFLQAPEAASTPVPSSALAGAAATADIAAVTAADDLRLLLPVDPTNPSYYWKPVNGSDGRSKPAGANVIDNILGAQLLLDAGCAEGMPAPTAHVRQRKSILLRLPLGTEHFLGAVPAAIQDHGGHACLLVLPSDKPSNRKEAGAVEDLLAAALQDPNSAVSLACQWRAATLAALCCESLGVVAEAIKQRRAAASWQFRQLTRNLTGKVLGSDMAEALGSLVTSSQVTDTATQMVRLLNSKEAAAQVATAAAEVTALAAAAAAPVAVRPLAAAGFCHDAAAAAAAELTAAEATSQQRKHQQHRAQLQQQCSQISSARSSQAGGLAASRLQSPHGCRTERNSSWRVTESGQQQTSHHQQQPGNGQADAMVPSSTIGGSSTSTERQPSASRGSTSGDLSARASRMQPNGAHAAGYSSLTVAIGSDCPSSSGQQQGMSPRAGAAQGDNSISTASAAVSTLPGSRLGSAASLRLPSHLNPALRAACDAAGRTADPSSAEQQLQQQSQQQLQQEHNQPDGSCSTPKRGSRFAGGSRCSTPASADGPSTPQGRLTAGSGSSGTLAIPGTGRSSRDISPGVVRCSTTSSSTTNTSGSVHDQDGAAALLYVNVDAACTDDVLASPTGHAASRLTSPFGPAANQQQNQLAVVQPTEQQLVQALVEDCSDDGGCKQGERLSSLYGLSLSAAICVADLVRQVEVSCVERGHALAYAWNCSISAAEAVAVELRTQNQQLLHINSQLAADQQELAKELKGVDFLRREALRFRRSMEDAQERLGQASADNAQLKAKLEAAAADLAAVEAYVSQKLAKLRWRNAIAVLGTWSQQSTVQSGGLKGEPGQLLKKVIMLEKMVAAVHAVEHRKAAFGRTQQKELYEPRKGSMVDMVQVMTLGPQVATPGHSHDGSAQMMTVLTPEARTIMLASMPTGQRWKVLEAMRDDERADVVIAMAPSFRREAAAALESRLWDRTVDVIRNSSAMGARYLKTMDIEDAALEFLTWGVYQQLDAMGGLDMYTAAALMTRMPDALRKELLSMMEPYVAANIVQAMMPPPAAAAVDSLELKKAMAILTAMDPNKAADVLTEMGPPQAANKLMLMEADARNSILESMAPKAAADTLTSMEGVLQEVQEGRGSSSDDEDLELESPVMGAMRELPTGNAYNIMSFMSIKDKAALLATMEPDAVARLLASMDPHEAVLLLSALGDGSSNLVSNCLSNEERQHMIEVLQDADCKPAAQRGKPPRRSRVKGSFRNSAPEDAVERLVDAYQAIEAVAMEEREDADAAAAATAAQSRQHPAGNRGGADHLGSKQQQGQGSSKQQRNAQQPPSAQAKGVLVQVGAADGTACSTTAASGGSAAGASEGAPTRARRGGKVSSSTGYLADADEADAVAAGPSAAAAGSSTSGVSEAKGSKSGQQARAPKAAPSAAGDTPGTIAAATAGAAANKRSAAAATAAPSKDNHPSSSGVEGDADAAEITDTPSSKHAAGAGAKKPVQGSSNSKPPAALSAPKQQQQRYPRASDAEGAIAGGGGGGVGAVSRRGSTIGAAVAEAVPPLQLAGRHSDTSGGEETPPTSSSRRVRYAEDETSGEEATLSGDSTPRTNPANAAPGRGPSRAAGAAAAAAAGKSSASAKALKEALKSRAAAKKQATATVSGGGNGAGAFVSRDGGHAAVTTADEEDGALELATGPSGGGLQAEPTSQVKLGRVPKNARLIEAMAQHKNAKPKPKGWLMAVVDSIYKEGEALLRKLGRADMIKKQSVPEVVFAYFHNKYGQRALVNENVGSLVNTLTLYQHTDLRLEAFARLLSEEWDVSVFLDFINAQNMCMQPAKVACIEYPREASKDDQYPWVCLWKAVWVADAILGARSQAARDRFNEFLQMASAPADDNDVERLRRERREAAAKDGLKGGAGDTDLPDKFYKLPRIRFLLLLCKEILRINRFISTVGEDRFTAMDVQHIGKLGVVAVRGFVKTWSPGANDLQVSDNISAFVSIAEGAVRDIPPEQVSVATVTELNREAFVAGVTNTPMTRDYVKTHMLPAARMEEEDGEAQIFFSLLAVLMVRHSKALLPTWEEALQLAGQHASSGALQQQLVAVTAPSTAADARLKAYVGLVLGLINVSVQTYIDDVLGNWEESDVLDGDQLEQGLYKLEDAALILVHGCSYLLADNNQDMAVARIARLPLAGQTAAMSKELQTYRGMRASMVTNAVLVLQRVWRARQRRLLSQEQGQQPVD